MGVISDAINSFQEWCENLFKDGIKSQLDSTTDSLIPFVPVNMTILHFVFPA